MEYVIGQYINGQHIENPNADTLDILNPATATPLGKVQFATSDEVNAAVEAAKTAFTTWSETPPLKRARVLFKFKTLLEQHHDEIAEIVTLEHGKTFEDAKGSVHRAIEVIEMNCGIASHLRGAYSESVGSHIDTFTLRQPLGVCAGVSPFNFPVMVPAWMMIPAIACGNTFILKPSEQDPKAPIRLLDLLHEAGLPKGVVNILNGDKNVVTQLMHHPDIKAMTAVASTPVARSIYETAIQQGKRAHTFGGAKNHCLVMPDANIEQTANAIAGAAFGAAGERCMALSVAVVIGDDTADQLIQAVEQNMKTIKVGSGLEDGVEMGPLISEAHLEKVKQYIQVGVDEGASLLVDGRQGQHATPGFFLNPSLFDHVTESMRIYQEEIFGPVLCVVRVKTFDEGLSLINRHQFGNGTAIFTHDGYAARDFAHRVQAGMVGVNIPIPVPVASHPFGGWKHSVFGDTNMHGFESVHFYTKQKTVTSRWIKDEVTQSAYVMPTSK